MYLANLNDLPISRLAEAFNRAVRECKFFPTVAEIRSFEAEVEIPQKRIQEAYERRKQQIMSTPHEPKILKSAFLDGQTKPKRKARRKEPNV